MSICTDIIKVVIYMKETLVFSIEEFSTFDGPGIRTSVFLKGCPLRCSWCHNPEGQSYDNEIMKSQNGCLGCGACLRAGNGKLTGDSISVCPNRLLRYSGIKYTPEALVEKLEKNFQILKISGGGITFSGGEPLTHPDFVIDCLRLLQGRIHTAIQTCGHCDAEVFDRVLTLADYFLFDIKLIDRDAHKRYCGVYNDKILRNFHALRNSGKAFVIRTPLIPGVTDTPENLTAIAQLLKKSGINYIELLPYNKVAGGKYAAVGRVFAPDYDESVPCQPRKEIFEALGIQAKIM